MRVLLTGFGPFPGASVNPSAWLAEALPGRLSGFAAELHARVLPTEWEAVAGLTQSLHATVQPQVTIHFGLSQSARGFRIEQSAYNRASPRADAAGALPPSRAILAHGQARLDTMLPAAALSAHLRERGIPALLSRSAGRYLCNFLYYLSLDWAARQSHTPAVLFVHIPPFARCGGPLDETALLDGAEAVLRFALRFAGQAPRSRAHHQADPGRAPL